MRILIPTLLVGSLGIGCQPGAECSTNADCTRDGDVCHELNDGVTVCAVRCEQDTDCTDDGTLVCNAEGACQPTLEPEMPDAGFPDGGEDGGPDGGVDGGTDGGADAHDEEVSIDSFTPSASAVNAGTMVTLSYATSFATGCSINGGAVNLDANGSGTFDVNPTTTTTYELSCSGPGGPATDSVEVAVSALTNFEAGAPVIGEGESVELTWAGENLTSCLLNGDPVAGGNAMRTPDETTTYTLVCEGPEGALPNLTAEVVVLGVPTVNADDQVVLFGQTTTINYASTEATGCVVTDPSGAQVGSGPGSGTFEDVTVEQSGDWEVTCSRTVAGQTATTSATVTIHLAVTITDAALHVVNTDSGLPEAHWAQVGAAACFVDEEVAELTTGLLIDPMSTGPATHTVRCQGSGGDEDSVELVAWWGNLFPADLATFDSSLATVVVGQLLLDNTTNVILAGTTRLTEVSARFSVNNNTALVAIPDFGALTAVGGDFAISSNPALGSIAMPVLATVGGTFDIGSNITLGSITMPALTTVSGSYFYVQNNTNLACTEAQELRDQLVAPLPGDINISPNEGTCS